MLSDQRGYETQVSERKMFTNVCGEVVASHSDIRVRARGWCDNGGVSVE